MNAPVNHNLLSSFTQKKTPVQARYSTGDLLVARTLVSEILARYYADIAPGRSYGQSFKN
jgi:hypothetical protein